MGHKVYTLTGDNLTVANAAVTLAFINPGATGPDIKVLRISVSQAGTLVLRQRVQIVTQPTSFPTLVSATPSKGSSADIGVCYYWSYDRCSRNMRSQCFGRRNRH